MKVLQQNSTSWLIQIWHHGLVLKFWKTETAQADNNTIKNKLGLNLAKLDFREGIMHKRIIFVDFCVKGVAPLPLPKMINLFAKTFQNIHCFKMINFSINHYIDIHINLDGLIHVDLMYKSIKGKP